MQLALSVHSLKAGRAVFGPVCVYVMCACVEGGGKTIENCYAVGVGEF